MPYNGALKAVIQCFKKGKLSMPKYMDSSGHFWTTVRSQDREGKRHFGIAHFTTTYTPFLDCSMAASGWHFVEVKGPAMEAILLVMKSVSSKADSELPLYRINHYVLIHLRPNF